MIIKKFYYLLALPFPFSSSLSPSSFLFPLFFFYLLEFEIIINFQNVVMTYDI